MTNDLKPLFLADSFTFSCYSEVACFNRCCRDLNQLLTPYDILRLKNSLKLDSTDFLKQYTRQHVGPESGFPVITLKTDSGMDLRCPFVTSEGCGVYDDRPASCRVYPLARVVSRSRETCQLTEQYYLMEESHCLGHNEQKLQCVKDWIDEQGLAVYNEMNDLLMELISLKNRMAPGPMDERSIRLFHMALYDMDRFRSFASNNEALREKADFEAIDDTSLLRIGIEWIKQELFLKLET